MIKRRTILLILLLGVFIGINGKEKKINLLDFPEAFSIDTTRSTPENISIEFYNKGKALESIGMLLHAEISYKIAEKYNNKKQVEIAIDNVTKKLTLRRNQPEKAKILNEIGELQFKKGNYKEATKYFIKALNYYEIYGAYWSNLAESYLMEGNDYGAKFASTVAIIRTNNSTIRASAYYILALLYERNSNILDAYVSYLQAEKNKKRREYEEGIKRMKKKLLEGEIREKNQNRDQEQKQEKKEDVDGVILF